MRGLRALGGRTPLPGTRVARAESRAPLTQRDDEEAHVAQPVGGLVGQLLHEEPQNGAEVMLRSRHGDLHGGRGLGIAVAAAVPQAGREGTDASGSRPRREGRPRWARGRPQGAPAPLHPACPAAHADEATGTQAPQTRPGFPQR